MALLIKPRLAFRLSEITRCRRTVRSFSKSVQFRNNDVPRDEGPTTHFGFQTVAESKKAAKVGNVFSSVAASYDTMNDLMSLGIHRLWKDHFVRSLEPGSFNASKKWNMLDIAGGTGDIAFRLLDYATKMKNDTTSTVTVLDINPDMLAEGRKRSQETPYVENGRLVFAKANAESLLDIESNSIDLYTVAFGIRNFTNKQKALEEAYRVLKPGGLFACLEFSKVDNRLFNAIYKRWSFGAIPLIGQVVAADRDSYQYLVESIEKFPSQSDFRNMITKAGFETSRQGFENLSGGIAAIHKGIKPIDQADPLS